MAFCTSNIRNTVLKMEIVFYDLTKSHKTIIKQSLISFGSELTKHIQDFERLKIRCGNDEYPDTFDLLETTIVPLIKNREFSTDEALDELRENTNDSPKDSFRDNLILIVLPDSSIHFKEWPGAHGIATGGTYIFLKEYYRNIICHETAHFFGAEDHYDPHNGYKMIRECSNPSHCLMQWDPASKDVVFCSKTLEEIRFYLYGDHS